MLIEKIAELRNNQVVTIRPLAEGDRTKLLEFGAALPQDDWLYLEDDLRNPDVIARLLNVRGAEHWRQIVAVGPDGSIAAYSSIAQLPGWSSHVANIKLLVAESWRRTGLGTRMAATIVEVARELGAAKLTVRMLEEQRTGQAIFGLLGFTVEGVLKNHARDRLGERRSLVIMSYLVR